MKKDNKETEEKSFKRTIQEAGRSARKKAFKKDLPYAISKNGQVILVYPDKHKEFLPANNLQSLSK